MSDDDQLDPSAGEHQETRADALVMFGLTGDLGTKKLFPALYELAAAGRLGIPVVGVGRSEHSDDDIGSMRDDALDGYRPAGGRSVDRAVVDSIDLSYIGGDSTETSTLDAIADRLDGVSQPVVYAAIPPGIFGDVARAIAGSKLPASTRFVTEKPFGDDADSAADLYAEVTDALGTERLFIVDHFLAKSAIENMLTVRTSNALIANSMCSQFVESIELVMDETGDVDGRGSFYDSVGAVDDVLQNHLLQMLAILTMEPPIDDTDAAYHDARSALLESIRPFVADRAMFGQYSGYRDVENVADDSTTETFVAVETTIDNDRWRDVPVRLRTGKALAHDRTEATITLRCDERLGEDQIQNRVRFLVKPNASVTFELGVLDPDTHDPIPTEVYACGPEDHGDLGDYAVMLDNALAGDTRHFAHIDDVVAAWKLVAPLHAADKELVTYEPGATGASIIS